MGDEHPRTTFGRGGRDPTVRDLLADPITQLLMERDGVGAPDLLDLIATVRTRLSPRHGARPGLAPAPRPVVAAAAGRHAWPRRWAGLQTVAATPGEASTAALPD